MSTGARRAAAVGVVAVALYGVLAAWSASISPTARLPLLDGLGPAQPYRWVAPPPDLAATNQAPSAGSFQLELTGDGVRGAVFITSDNQVTAIVPDEAIGPHGDDDSVDLEIVPVDPGTLSPPPGDLEYQGNAYRIAATYQPSGARVAAFDQPIDVVLLYPVSPNIHVATHEMLLDKGSGRWRQLPTIDSPAQQQVEASVGTTGLVAVAGEPAPAPLAPEEGGGADTLAIGLVVAALCVALVGVGFLLRSRR